MRKAVSEISGVMAVMTAANINTDAIIPSSWLRTANADLAKGLFGGQRYDAAGKERSDFILNQPVFRGARILLADENFGCGSSREAAVWALVQFGIQCVLAPSFADIFYENAFRNALVPGLIDVDTMHGLAGCVQDHGSNPVFHVDLRSLQITGPNHRQYDFRVPPLRAEALINGYDEIDMTMRHAGDIDAHYKAATAERAWLFAETGERGGLS
ncbi:3-isopropylmalate dehydratase small subunit [Mesorhizobium sp. PUT5]|uniref:3-isopropylmalate dehydratase small subunit n=1 Tax=Mesorhizobium sp. PUT5 TaxID=3454629 RepID=UPI003FA42063